MIKKEKYYYIESIKDSFKSKSYGIFNKIVVKNDIISITTFENEHSITFHYAVSTIMNLVTSSKPFKLDNGSFKFSEE